MLQSPTILKLKTLEFEIELLIRSYETSHQTYLHNIISKNYKEASETLMELDQTNTKLITLVNRGKILLNKAIKEGSINQTVASMKKPQLDRIIKQANAQQKIIHRREQELTDVDGELESSSYHQTSSYLQFVIFVIVGIIVIGLTIKTMITPDESAVDNAILVIVVGFMVYFIIKKIL
jgi:hypothetical protein